MIDLYGVLSVEESLNGNLNLGVDYYKGNKGDKGDKGDTPIKGVDYYTLKDKEELKAEISSEIIGLDSLTNSDILAIWQTY